MDTFVVRVWDAGEADPAADPLRGTALHVASGESTPFVGADELLAFFATVSVRSPGNLRPPGTRTSNGDLTTADGRGREQAAARTLRPQPRLSAP
jgi:hypothetical protein